MFISVCFLFFFIFIFFNFICFSLIAEPFKLLKTTNRSIMFLHFYLQQYQHHLFSLHPLLFHPSKQEIGYLISFYNPLLLFLTPHHLLQKDLILPLCFLQLPLLCLLSLLALIQLSILKQTD